MLPLRQFLEFTPARAQKPWHADRRDRMNGQGRFSEGKDAYQAREDRAEHERMSLYRVK